MLLAAMVIALAAPLAATASPGKGKTPVPPKTPVTQPTQPTSSTPAPPTGRAANVPGGKSWVDKSLLNDASSTPNAKIDVIVQSSGGSAGATRALQWLQKIANNGQVNTNQSKSLSMIGGIAITIPAKWLPYLQQVQGLVVTPDSPVRLSGDVTDLASNDLWPYESGNADAWSYEQQYEANNTPAIALIDSGVEQRDDFGARVIASVNLSTQAGDDGSTNDDNGHGTFVAGVAAGSAPDLAGADPVAPLVSIKVMNSEGEAKTSDIITACQWIIDHKDQYNIKVANFSLHSSYGTNFYRDPLDRAVEALWFDGVTVVAASGNYGTDSGPSGVLYSPGNDPFIITVGALDINGTADPSDDSVAPWSAYGNTYDGFSKPDVVAPGRYIVGPVPAGSTLTSEKASNMVGTDRIQLSGTSFAAPVVSGTVAAMLAAHPNLTPDQIKGILEMSTRIVGQAAPGSAGAGQITASRALSYSGGPNANLALDQYVTPDPNGGSIPVFDATSWAAAAQANSNWDASTYADQSWSNAAWTDAAWTDAAWTDAAWTDAAWTDAAWTDAAWTDAAWTDAAWTDAAWTDAAWTDAAWTDESAEDVSTEDAATSDSTAGTAGYAATPDQVAAALADPNIAIFKLTNSTTTDTTSTDTASTDTSDNGSTDSGSTDSGSGSTDSGSTDGGATNGGSGN